MKVSLYEISEAINKIEEYIEDEKSLNEYLDSLSIQFEDKVSNILKYRRTLELTAGAISNEIERLSALKKYYDLRSENLKNYLSYSMNKIGKDSLELDIAKLSFRKSETTEILDDKIIPNKFKKEVIKIVIDKKEIKNSIKSGKNVPGATITEHKNLQIK